MSYYEEETAPPRPRPIRYATPTLKDPLAVIGLVTVLAGTAVLIAVAWSYWNYSDFASFGDEGGGLSTWERVRYYVADVEEPLYIVPLLLGVVLASLRELLHLLDATPSLARTWARAIGFAAGAILAVGGVLTAIDLAFIRDDGGEGFGPFPDTRWQTSLQRLAAAALAALTTWIVARGRRPSAPPPPPPAGIWPYAGD